jgi:hypothetical protein
VCDTAFSRQRRGGENRTGLFWAQTIDESKRIGDTVYDTAYSRLRKGGENRTGLFRNRTIDESERICDTVYDTAFSRLRKGGENCKRDLAINLSLVLKETLDHFRSKAPAYGTDSSYGSARLCTGLFRDRRIDKSERICDTVYDTASPRLRKGGENCKRDLATNLSLVLKENLDHFRPKAQAYGSDSSTGPVRSAVRDRQLLFVMILLRKTPRRFIGLLPLLLPARNKQILPGLP